MWRTHDAMGWWMLFSGVLWVMFWVFIVGTISSLFGTRTRSQNKHEGSIDDPDRIAARRYANGDIDRDEYEQLRQDLVRPKTSA